MVKIVADLPCHQHPKGDSKKNKGCDIDRGKRALAESCEKSGWRSFFYHKPESLAFIAANSIVKTTARARQNDSWTCGPPYRFAWEKPYLKKTIFSIDAL